MRTIQSTKANARRWRLLSMHFRDLWNMEGNPDHLALAIGYEEMANNAEMMVEYGEAA